MSAATRADSIREETGVYKFSRVKSKL